MLADEFIWREASEGLEPAGEIAGGDEVGEVSPELIVAIVVKALDVASLMVRFILST
ncbi:hypothetical protein J2X13_002662 [Aminobacter aminovorans]|nr:hypothetical protein [Aminobacter aminovorans]